jgi:hypothetical protein
MITKVELLPTKLGRENYRKLSLFWKRKHFQPVEVTEAIIDLANEIREFYSSQGKTPPATPDSIHLATAIKIGVSVFQTFDGGRKRGILQMDGNVAGRCLSVKKPFVPQTQLQLAELSAPAQSQAPAQPQPVTIPAPQTQPAPSATPQQTTSDGNQSPPASSN